MDVKHAGLGVLIQALGGNAESVATMLKAVGQTIASVALTDNALHFVFDNGFKMKFSDEGQSCCESRYMRTDDDLTQFVGAKLVAAEVRQAPDIEDEYGTHEVAFLVVNTDRGNITTSTHNEHNGYYGGF